MKVALVSSESWVDVWRRNQHLGVELIRQGRISSLWFVEPPQRGLRSTHVRPVSPGVVALTPSSPLPDSMGGFADMGRRLRRHLVEGADLLWIDDPLLGARCLTSGTPTIYDVSDDPRSARPPSPTSRRIFAAEDRLARRATIIASSQAKSQQWQARYGVRAPIVPNGAGTADWDSVTGVQPTGPGPHIGYVGTLHERLDIDLVVDLTHRPEIGTVHLVGTDRLDPSLSQRLRQVPGLRLHDDVAPHEASAWMTAMDVLISPNRVDDLDLSLDLTEAHEYTASGRPVVATPTSGFTLTDTAAVVPAAGFADEVVRAIKHPLVRPSHANGHSGGTWADRAEEFWSLICTC